MNATCLNTLSFGTQRAAITIYCSVNSQESAKSGWLLHKRTSKKYDKIMFSDVCWGFFGVLSAVINYLRRSHFTNRKMVFLLYGVLDNG